MGRTSLMESLVPMYTRGLDPEDIRIYDNIRGISKLVGGAHVHA